MYIINERLFLAIPPSYYVVLLDSSPCHHRPWIVRPVLVSFSQRSLRATASVRINQLIVSSLRHPLRPPTPPALNMIEVHTAIPLTTSSSRSELKLPLLADRQEGRIDTNDKNNNESICSWSGLLSVSLGFLLQMIVFGVVDSCMGHPTELTTTLPVSICISVVLVVGICSIPLQYFEAARNILASPPFFSGFFLGFIIQVVSLGSTAAIALKWGKHGSDNALYYALFALSQSWWLLLPVICLAIDGGLTGNDRSMFGRFFFSDNPKATRREIFLGGVYFHLGIVLGCFLVWSSIDMHFGASAGVLVTLSVSFLACLALCYAMVRIHDRFLMVPAAMEEGTSQLEEPLLVNGLMVV